MSGLVGRIKIDENPVPKIVIKGFNKSVSFVDEVGVNEDGKTEYYVKSMPPNLTLLCAQDYASEGAAILFPNDGLILKMTEDESFQLRQFLKKFEINKNLVVRNRTYEVCEKELKNAYLSIEESNSSTATRYFNSKVNVSNTEERILATLLTGLSFEDIYTMAKHENTDGMPREITVKALNRFAQSYGRTPDVLQLALPNLAGNSKGYMAPIEKVMKCGARVEVDFLESEFNEDISDSSDKSLRKKSRKLPTHGGAIAAYVSIDVYSGFIHGYLVKSLADPLVLVKRTISQYALENNKVEKFAADVGILSQSHFRVFLPAVETFLEAEKIRSEVGEAYNHNNGTSHIERAIRSIKELIRFAILYIFNNPNFKHFGFTKTQVLKLWGDLFYWSLTIINLKPCVNVSDKTKFEVFYKKKPDLRSIRLLPIFSVLYVLRRTVNENNSNREFWQKGIYVGPSDKVPGAIRAAIVTRGQVKMVITTVYKSVSDGGNLNLYPIAEHSILNLDNSSPSDKTKDNIQNDENIDNSDLIESPSGVFDDIYTEENLDENAIEDSPSEMQEEVNIDTNNILDTHILEQNNNNILKKKKKKRFKANKNNNKLKSVHFAPINNENSTFEVPEAPKNDNLNSNTLTSKSKLRGASALKDQEKFEAQKSMWGTRAERAKKREENRACIATNLELTEECNFVDWTSHEENKYYLSFSENLFIIIESNSNENNFDDIGHSSGEEVSFRAVTENVPKSFTAALQHPEWGEPARAEFGTIMVETRAVVEIDQTIAIAHIKNGAEVLRMIAVYEEKIKEGKLVRKVRLVADGRHHHKHGATYSPTPSREELLILLHLFSANDYDYYHIDEVRAFLNAPKQDNHITFAKFSGDPKYYEIKGALYGMKTASRDYQDTVAERMLQLGFQRLHICSCIYYREKNNNCVWVYDYVDDFICGGTANESTLEFISEFRMLANTTEPDLNASLILGMEIIRDKIKRTIYIRMEKRIDELVIKYSDNLKKKRNVPMPTTGFLVRDYEFDLLPEHKSRYLTEDEVSIYMSIVGSLIWIQGIRLDIIFAVLYLSWFTKKPRVHHLNMAYYCIGYLASTADVPLVLGGFDKIKTTAFCDSSLGTGPNSRSITGNLVKLNSKSGAVSAKAQAGQSVKLSSFEAELDGVTTTIKTISRISNILKELNFKYDKQSILYNDNQAMINFVHGEGVAKGVRHMELRMWYVREEYKKGSITLDYMAGEVIPADKLTKLGNLEEHRRFRKNVLGLDLGGLGDI